MGMNLSALRLIVIVCSTLMTACVVSMAGVIGWIGLMVPHIARLLVGPSLPLLLPATTLIGASYCSSSIPSPAHSRSPRCPSVSSQPSLAPRFS